MDAVILEQTKQEDKPVDKMGLYRDLIKSKKAANLQKQLVADHAPEEKETSRALVVRTPKAEKTTKQMITLPAGHGESVQALVVRNPRAERLTKHIIALQPSMTCLTCREYMTRAHKLLKNQLILKKKLALHLRDNPQHKPDYERPILKVYCDPDNYSKSTNIRPIYRTKRMRGIMLKYAANVDDVTVPIMKPGIQL